MLIHTDAVTLTFNLQNERACKGHHIVTTYQVWLKYLQLFSL